MIRITCLWRPVSKNREERLISRIKLDAVRCVETVVVCCRGSRDYCGFILLISQISPIKSKENFENSPSGGAVSKLNVIIGSISGLIKWNLEGSGSKLMILNSSSSLWAEHLHDVICIRRFLRCNVKQVLDDAKVTD